MHLEAPLEWPRSGTHVSLQGLQGEEDGVGEDVCQRVLDKVGVLFQMLSCIMRDGNVAVALIMFGVAEGFHWRSMGVENSY